jgi:hypothetical protein
MSASGERNDHPTPSALLHIRCGDDILERLKEANLPGDMIRWADALCQGPTPWGLIGDDWCTVRARHAADNYGLTFEQAMEFLSAQDRDLERFRSHEAVLLWFEHDPFDQIVLIYLLDWFSHQELGTTRLLLISSARHLGYMHAQQLAVLFESKQHVTSEQIALARRAWRAYCAPEPESIQSLIQSDTSALPFLRGALIRHCQEFPSRRNGLGLTEQPARTISITSQGTAVLSGAKDSVKLNGILRWLVGTHLVGCEADWRWDESSRSICAFS